MESHLEARLWNDVFNFAQDDARHPARHHPRHGADRNHPRARSRWTRSSTNCATTPPASTAAAGITFSASSRNSAIARTSSCPIARRSPWTAHFLKSYVDLLIQTCHRRGIHAMGGMAAQIPIKNDPAANERALEKVRAGQAARSEGRPRRHLGRASRPGADRQGNLRRAHEDAEPDSTSSAKTCTSPPHDLLDSSRRRHHRSRVCAGTSTSASNTSKPGCAATAACRSTT